jgi:PAS domain S-box-containing protein
LGVVLGLGSSAHALDPQRKVTQYGHDTWTHQNGLPAGAVYGVWQLPDGYLWLRQASGVLRFDGIRFIKVPLTVHGQAVDEDIRAAARTPDGKLVLRGPTRTLYLSRGTIEDAATPARLLDGNDRIVMQARDGTIWLGADSNIYRIRGDRLEAIALGTGWVSAIHEDAQGRVWIGAGTGLYRFADEKLLLYPTGYNEAVSKTTLPLEKIRGETNLTTSVTAIAHDRHGALWVGCHDGLYKVVNGTIQRDFVTEALTQRQVTALFEDRHGNMWVGSDGDGLFRLTGERWSHFDSDDGLSDNGICSLAEDDEGSLWIGTRSGLDRLRDTPLATLSAREGLSHDNVSAIVETQEGHLHLYTYGGGITTLRDGEMSYLTRDMGLGSDYAAAMYVARDGTLWLGASEELRSYKNGVFTSHPAHGLLQNSFISCIHEDDEGIVLGTSQLRLFRFKDGVYSPYEIGVPPGDKPANARYVYAMHRDDEGTLWLAMTAGLWRVPRGSRPEDAIRTSFDKPTHTLYDDGKGYLWVSGPETRGFARIRKSDNQLVLYGPDAGLPPGKIGRVITDEQGNLWAGTGSGILNISRTQADLFAEKKVRTLETRLFRVTDGMKTEEAAGGDHQPSAVRSRDGRLYFATRKGVVIVDPAALPRNKRVPPVVIEELVSDTGVYPRPDKIHLGPGTDAIEIHYTALSLLAPGRVRFKYKLSGYHTDWVDADTRRTAYFTKLPPQQYRFQVIAANEDGVWNDMGAAITFTLKPRFYQTIWFYLACAAGIALSAVGLHRIRVRRLRRREAELIATVEERTGKLRAEIAEHTEARRELQRYRAYLEQLVAERTAALQNSNVLLQREINERRLSEDRYRRFFDEDLAGAFIATPAGRLVTYNPSFARIFGFDKDAEPGTAELSSLFADPSKAAEVVTRLRGGGKVQDEELEMKSSQGRILSVVANIIGSFSGQGDLLEIKGYIVDNTDRKRLENQLRQSQKMEAIGQLAGGVAHDFNNLLTAIIGSSDCILEEPGITHDTQKLAKEIREAGQRAAALTRQLLAFSRKQVLQPKVINLNQVITEMETMLRRLIGEDVRLRLSLSTHLLNVRADPSQMQQVVLNLSVNARDAMPQGGLLTINTHNVRFTRPELRQNLSVPAGHYVCLTVSDSGSGMSPEVQTHIFEPFFTTKGPGKGTGLGLSTVYGIVQQTNGHILFSSEEGRGTTFQVYLPVVSSEVTPELPPGTMPPFQRGGERVLLVEDNELVLGVAQRCLQQFGFEVVEATNGFEALEKCRRENGEFDLMITDIVMPDMNGRELADYVRKEYPAMKVLFMSGYTGDVLGRVGELSTASILEKPFTPDTLLRRVREALDGPALTQTGR